MSVQNSSSAIKLGTCFRTRPKNLGGHLIKQVHKWQSDEPTNATETPHHTKRHHLLEEVHGVGPSQRGAVVETVWQEGRGRDGGCASYDGRERKWMAPQQGRPVSGRGGGGGGGWPMIRRAVARRRRGLLVGEREACGRE
jgi:hypothetical protein